jgi:hypothetical protein
MGGAVRIGRPLCHWIHGFTAVRRIGGAPRRTMNKEKLHQLAELKSRVLDLRGYL